MSKIDETALVPKYRFPEFRDSGDWKSDCLGKLSLILRGGSPRPIDSFLTNDINGLNWLKIGDVNKEAKYIYKTSTKVVKEAFSKTREVQPGDLIMSNSMSFGRPYILKIKTCIHDGWIAVTEIKDFIIANYLYYFILSNESQKYFLNAAAGGGIKNLNAEIIKLLLIKLPLKDEQQKIADCLSSLDDLIAAEDKKLDALKTHKKGLMQKLFPAEGKTVPEWRFPEFRDTGEWQNKKLGQFANILMCKRIFSYDTNQNDGVPFYKIGTLGGIPDAFISQELFDDFKFKYNYPKTGEILITCSGTVGKCVPYDGKDAYYQDSNIVWIDNPSLEVTNELLFNLLGNENWAKLSSTTITRIYGSDLRGLSIVFPENKEEQQKISNFLSSSDSLIFAQTEKVEGLKMHKKALMQGLLPALEKLNV